MYVLNIDEEKECKNKKVELNKAIAMLKMKWSGFDIIYIIQNDHNIYTSKNDKSPDSDKEKSHVTDNQCPYNK